MMEGVTLIVANDECQYCTYEAWAIELTGVGMSAAVYFSMLRWLLYELGVASVPVARGLSWAPGNTVEVCLKEPLSKLIS